MMSERSLGVRLMAPWPSKAMQTGIAPSLDTAPTEAFIPYRLARVAG
jgi:hypothetical protein